MLRQASSSFQQLVVRIGRRRAPSVDVLDRSGAKLADIGGVVIDGLLQCAPVLQPAARFPKEPFVAPLLVPELPQASATPMTARHVGE